MSWFTTEPTTTSAWLASLGCWALLLVAFVRHSFRLSRVYRTLDAIIATVSALREVNSQRHEVLEKVLAELELQGGQIKGLQGWAQVVRLHHDLVMVDWARRQGTEFPASVFPADWDVLPSEHPDPQEGVANDRT